MVNQLSSIDVTEISLVPAPAVPSAQILLAKSANDMTATEGFNRIVRIAKSANPGVLDSACYLWALSFAGDQHRQPGESGAQAFARFCNTDEGRALYQAMRR